MSRGRRAGDTHGRRGFTLAEMLVAVSVVAVLMAGICSTILLASKALPDAQNVSSRALAASRVARQIADELAQAVHIAERAERCITFTVADRDGDGSPERIRYCWSGLGGAPLTRQYNGGAEVTVLDDVWDLRLSYDVTAATEEYPTLPVEGPEVLLSSFNVSSNLKDYKVDKDKWVGQYFRPTFADDVVCWSVNRVFVVAQSDGPANEYTLVQLRPADQDGKPTATVLEEQILQESSLSSSYAWAQVLFGMTNRLPPGQGLCLVLAHPGSGGPSGKFLYSDNRGSGMVHTSNRGGTWDYNSSRGLWHYIYGTTFTPGAPQAVTRHYVTGVRVSVQAGEDDAGRVDTAAALPNAPEILSALWFTDFNSNPTTLDYNADGLGDWVPASGGTFSVPTLSGGVWQAYTRLDTYPNCHFTDITSIVLRCRVTSTSGKGTFRIRPDAAAGVDSSLAAAIQYKSNGTQTLTVSTVLGGTDETVIKLVEGLPGDFVDLRLMIDPAAGTVNIRVNDVDTGTYPLGGLSFPGTGGPGGFASLEPSGGGVEYDFVSIRVAGTP